MDNVLVLALLLFSAFAVYMEETFHEIRWLLIIAAVVLLWAADRLYFFRFRLKRKSTLKTIDRMEGVEFEQYAAALLKANGYKKVRVTPPANDQGIDLFAEKDGVSYAIQCKRYHGKVGNKAIQEAVAGCGFYHCDVPVVLTNSFFTVSAVQLAEENGVELWNREDLTRLIKNL